jgi:hypothetical protein
MKFTGIIQLRYTIDDVKSKKEAEELLRKNYCYAESWGNGYIKKHKRIKVISLKENK